MGTLLPRLKTKIRALDYEPSEAAWEILEETVEPVLDDMKRHGLEAEALEICKGMVLGCIIPGHKSHQELLKVGLASLYGRQTLQS
jgi:hypothetical protein